MQEILNEAFAFEGRDYCVRAVLTGSEILVRAFDGQRPVSPLASVSLDTAFDFSPSFDTPARIGAGWCKQFVTDKTAEQYDEAMQGLRQHSHMIRSGSEFRRGTCDGR